MEYGYVHTVEGQQYYPFYIRNKVESLRVDIERVIFDLFKNHPDAKSWTPYPVGKPTEFKINFRDGIGFKITVELDHAPTITD